VEARCAIGERLVRQASHSPLRPGAPLPAYLHRESPLRMGVKDDGGVAFTWVRNCAFIGLRLYRDLRPRRLPNDTIALP
jgi:hypothetical protein